MATAGWATSDGAVHVFEVYGPGTAWNRVAGVYIFAFLSGGKWYPLYVGQTDDFSTRLPKHERWGEAARRGATHIHARVVEQAASRDYLEQKLIQDYQPPMNQQLR